jgi:hypothetical protein
MMTERKLSMHTDRPEKPGEHEERIRKVRDAKDEIRAMIEHVDYNRIGPEATMSGIWFGFEIAVGLVLGVIVMIRVLMFLRLVKYRRGNLYDAPSDLRNILMRENLEAMRKTAHKATQEQLSKGFRLAIEGAADAEAGWEQETLNDFVKTAKHLAKFLKQPEKVIEP